MTSKQPTDHDPTKTTNYSLDQIQGLVSKLPEPPGSISKEEIIAQGGMGIIFRAQQTIPKRNVAVKRTKQIGTEQEYLLLQEALVAGSLEHPNIVPIHQIRRCENGQIEIIMKLVQGTTLLELLKNQKKSILSTKDPLHILSQVCNALNFAHKNRVIHRDIKPANIMIGEFGETYLLDWGIAVQLDHLIFSPDEIVGTLSYMAPEMLSGVSADITICTDVYLLGATLHEILTGKKRHHGDTNTILHSIKESLPYEYPDTIPTPLAELANDACNKDPLLRPSSVLEFQSRLEAYLQHRLAIDLLETGKREMDKVSSIIKTTNTFSLERMKLYHHLDRARFAFEKAIDIDESFADAKVALQEMTDQLTITLLNEGNVDVAVWFAHASKNLSAEIREKLNIALQEKDAKAIEQNRLAELGKKIDPEKSKHSRKILTISVFVCAIFFIFYVITLLELKVEISQIDLLHQGVFLLIPTILVLGFARKKLLFDPMGHRAALTIIACVIGVVLTRWTGVFLLLPNKTILIYEKFVVGMAFFNSTPVFRSGNRLGLTFIATGVFCLLFPMFHIIGDLFSILALVFFFVYDFYVDQEGSE
jgi:eukaryotic-like serine/threonine-protein kinase